jgi:hypothetical protein
MRFNCDRTCPLYEQVDLCRFNPVFKAIGPVTVTSHTATIKCAFNNPDALAAAVDAMGGKYLGRGIHKLFGSNKAEGLGFTLPGWRYPLVANGEALSYDDYNGSWGNVQDIERLKAEYSYRVAEQAAMAQGWATERTEQGLVIHHPSGGTMLVGTAGVDASGFLGVGCHEAIMALGLEYDQLTAKPEYGQVQANIEQGS